MVDRSGNAERVIDWHVLYQCRTSVYHRKYRCRCAATAQLGDVIIPCFCFWMQQVRESSKVQARCTPVNEAALYLRMKTARKRFNPSLYFLEDGIQNINAGKKTVSKISKNNNWYYGWDHVIINGKPVRNIRNIDCKNHNSICIAICSDEIKSKSHYVNYNLSFFQQ